jgi:hypothetical protein
MSALLTSVSLMVFPLYDYAVIETHRAGATEMV